MSSIRLCTKTCYILFERWLRVFSDEEAGVVMEAQVSDHSDPAILRADDLESGIQAFRQCMSDSSHTEDGIEPRNRPPAAKRFVVDANDRVAVESHLFRFRLWAVHNSALSEKHDSLDWRLRRSTMAHSVVIDLLTDLSHAILLQNDSTLVPREVAQYEVDVALDRLFRYSQTIRRSGGLRRIMKAAGYVDHDTSGNNLSAKFRDCVKVYLDTTLGKVDVFLRARLLEAICIRQQTLAYQRSRRADNISSLAGYSSDSTSLRVRTTSETGPINSKTTSTSKQRQPSSCIRSLEPEKLSITASSATSFVSTSVLSSDAQTGARGTTLSLNDLPRRPKICQKQIYQECPYCFEICPVEDFTDSSWPRHIIEDIMPFVCTLEACSKPDILYDSEETWVRHMRIDHAVRGWTCMESTHDEPLFFSDKEEFLTHISLDHDDTLDTYELDLIAEECYDETKKDRIFDRCPFSCNEATPALSYDALTTHVATHLLRLAQISLLDHNMDSDIELSISANTASIQGALESQEDSSRDLSDIKIVQHDYKQPSRDNHSDLTEDSNDAAERMSQSSLLVPWSLELEFWTDAGDWDFVRSKDEKMSTHDQFTDETLQPFIKAYLEDQILDDGGKSSNQAQKSIAEALEESHQAFAREKNTFDEDAAAIAVSSARKGNGVTETQTSITPINTAFSGGATRKTTAQNSIDLPKPDFDSHRTLASGDNQEQSQGSGMSETTAEIPHLDRPYISFSGFLPRGRGTDIIGTYNRGSESVHCQPSDQSFYVRDGSFFVVGRVFAIIVDGNDGADTPTDCDTSLSATGMRSQDSAACANTRRFVVVRTKRYHCDAFPVFTYSERTTIGPRIDSKEHAVLHDSRKAPHLLPHESVFPHASIGVIMKDGEALNELSRIYFGMYHSVQYNVNVKDIGRVCAGHISSLLENWTEEEERRVEQTHEATDSGNEESPPTHRDLEWNYERQEWHCQQWDTKTKRYYWIRYDYSVQQWVYFEGPDRQRSDSAV